MGKKKKKKKAMVANTDGRERVRRVSLALSEREVEWRTGGRTHRQASMAETKVISRRSASHPHNLPALLESEEDERRGREERAERE